MACFLHHIFTLSLLCLVLAVSAEILTVHSSNNNNAASSVAVSVSNNDLPEVASSVLMAETWLRNHVLMYYPATDITHIVVAHNLLCSHPLDQHQHSYLHHHKLILPALKNMHHSLTRWGLQHHIKVSTSLTSHCLSSPHLTHSLLKPIFQFIHSTNSTYLINVESEIDLKLPTLVQTHVDFVKKIGSLSFFDDDHISLVQQNPTLTKPTMRKLSVFLSTAEGPLPPIAGFGPTISPPTPPSPYHTPHMGLSPSYSPHPHHNHHHNLPPCNPWTGPIGPVSAPPPPPSPPHAAPGPVVAQEKLWCVAKPSVPAETLQEAMDYACGGGGAECDEIQPSGNCYYPDTIVAHASYAFNSYFQKARRDGGTCDFGGTAMIINSDPSYLQCKFTVS